ncbi:DUF5626 family protein [Vagococcus sp. PNs007]|uniref:DUF5626 family protein n=1 Tax=Vagococcus proximus TaxID=2991417 RepID=A0ABT5X1L2_9ENTE|nr:DUF5626 family protein [Vagococcus proximus]
MWEVSYTGLIINCSFDMKVTNNKVTSVSNMWILTIGCTYSKEKLSKGDKYGKLSFNATDYMGIIMQTCWLKGTVTGKNNNINVSFQM